MKTVRRHRKKIRICALIAFSLLAVTVIRLVFLMVFKSEELSIAAEDLHERERVIKAARGRLISADGTVLADNRVYHIRSPCTDYGP